MHTAIAAIRKTFCRTAVILCVGGSVLLLSRVSPAGLPVSLRDFRVEIAGIDYGIFDQVSDIEHVDVAGDGQGYYEITLRRHFVAHPSLSFWAQRQQMSHATTTHITLFADDRGTVQRYQLRYCQPLSWSVEAVNTASGGYHEMVVLAVQEINIP